MKLIFLFMMIFCLSVVQFAQDEVITDSNKEIMKPVLVVIDTQNEYMPYMDEDDKKLGLEFVNWAIGIFRSNGFPIIRVYHTDMQGGPAVESEEFKFDSSVAIQEDDPMIIKNYANAFKKTELDKVIKDLGGNTLFLCGLSSVGCVIATYHGAMDHDYDVMLIEDALLSHSAEFTDNIEKMFNSVNISVLNTIIKYVPNN